MRRVLPFTGAAAAVVALGVAVTGATGVDEACAQGVAPRLDCPTKAPDAASCRSATLLSDVVVRPAGQGLRISFRRRVDRPVRVDVFQASAGRRVLGQRLVARRTVAGSAVRFDGGRQGRRAAPSDGYFFVRLRIRDARGRTDTRRVALRRAGARFAVRRAFQRRDACAGLRSFKLERPVFGGRGNRALGVSFRVAAAGRVTLELVRGGRVVRRLGTAERRGGILQRLRVASERLPRGRYEVRLRYAREGAAPVRAALFAQRL